VTLQPLGFKRVVLGLSPGAPISATALAVEFASLLDVELLGLFIDDLGLSHLEAMPTARAISALGAGWSRLPSHAPGAGNFAVEGAARHFAEASRRLQRRRFEVVRGGIAQAIATISRSDDIVVIVPPSTAAARAAEPFASLLAAAFGSAAAVLLVPGRLMRAAGSIVAIAAAPDDPSVDAAGAIAAATGENLVVVDMRGAGGEALRVELRSGVSNRSHAPIHGGPVDYLAEAAPYALRGLKERLTVLSRGAIRNDLALAIALARGAPVLSIDLRKRGRED
jgi:hypothetical protein